MAETELERAKRRYDQAKARLQTLRNREATKQRKLDTRRKVILGGALVDLAARDDTAAAMLDRLVRNLTREQDRKVFEDWDPPGAGTAEAPENGAVPEKARGRVPSGGVDLDALQEAIRTGSHKTPRRPDPPGQS